MKRELLQILRCPTSGEPLVIESDQAQSPSVEAGTLVTTSGRNRYPIVNGIPRFVPRSNYADNFGMQWNKFRQTQLDSFSGHPISADRFWRATNWRPEDMRGQWVLDAGCGAGRFAEVALSSGANVVAVDLSNAVDAARANLKQHERLHLVQASIYDLPFVAGSFAFVYSLGVLQHTPDVARAFAALPPLLRPGGSLAVDYYEKSWKSALHLKYWARPVTKRLPTQKLFSALEVAVPMMLPISGAIGAIPVVGRLLKRIVPVADYRGEIPLSATQHREWALLDTFDWFAPEFDNPPTHTTARRWMEEAGMKDIEVVKAGHLVARGSK